MVKFPLFYCCRRRPVTLVELRMHQFSGKIRSKPDWWEKVNNATIAAKWREEIVEHDRAMVDKLWSGEERYNHGDGEKKWPRDPITDAQLDYIFEDLKYDASKLDSATGIYPASIPIVYESRSLISRELKAKLVQGVSTLEDVPEEEKDWHPGTDKQALDLVHPSMYCLRIGQSYVRKQGAIDGSVEVITEEAYRARRPDFAEVYDQWVISNEYQWLPTDFSVSDTGDVKSLSYINNLHPTRHGALYPAISSILARFVPLFDKVLSDTLDDSEGHRSCIPVDPFSWYDENTFDESCGEDEDEWNRLHRWPTIPDPTPFSASAAEAVDDEYSLRGRKIQVIVKLANILLTPENPKYPGGSWHVEGMANERIVATGLYYYACENITESRLAFRAWVGDEDGGVELPYEQSDHEGYVVAYGFGRDGALNQPLGHIVAEEGKCVAFPNIYQHHVDEFELADPTKPGYRKILCFFLVDPEVEILSTTDVPPQQDWSVGEVERAPGALSKLPPELIDMVVDYVKEAVISRPEAEEHRARLMKERSEFVSNHNEQVYEMEFNMCEH